MNFEEHFSLKQKRYMLDERGKEIEVSKFNKEAASLVCCCVALSRDVHSHGLGR